MTPLNLENISDLEFDGIDHSDYPDYCDAYISGASVKDENGKWREATEEELEWLNKQGYFVCEKLQDYLY
jgi:hypothetical protein